MFLSFLHVVAFIFIMRQVSILSNALSISNEMVVCGFSFILLIWCSILIDFSDFEPHRNLRVRYLLSKPGKAG